MVYDKSSENPVYEEKLSSLRTEVLFVALALLFLALLAWRVMASGFGVIAAGLLFLFLLFCFYALNYRVLVIRILADKLILKFGVFGWTIPLHTIEEVYPDQTSLWRIGGAGIHFSIICGRYRAMFNFLEHGRVVVALSEKRGLVREVAFSTKNPDDIVHIFTAGACRLVAGSSRSRR
jgi:hypothetical protein